MVSHKFRYLSHLIFMPHEGRRFLVWTPTVFSGVITMIYGASCLSTCIFILRFAVSSFFIHYEPHSRLHGGTDLLGRIADSHDPFIFNIRHMTLRPSLKQAYHFFTRPRSIAAPVRVSPPPSFSMAFGRWHAPCQKTVM